MPEDQSLPLMIGEMRGQLRELNHNVNNLAQKFEDLMRTVDRTAHLPGTLEETKADLAALAVRVTALEALENQRKGAITLGAAIMKAMPWLIPAGAFGIVAALVGKAVGI